MYIEKFFLIISSILTLLVDNGPFREYNELEKDEIISIRLEDLPDEFTHESYDTVVEFIQKTKNLEYECIMYFDYVTGEMLKFAIGKKIRLKLNLAMENLKVFMLHQYIITLQEYILHPPTKTSKFYCEILKTMNWLLDKADYGF